MSDVVIRDLAGMAEFLQAEAVQRQVWGEGDLVDPADLMMVLQAEGGICAGAFRGADLLGFVFGFATRTPHIQHSHRLAMVPAARGLGLGLRLKWFQRDWCLARGITHVRWTYDPLRAANAGLNIHRLGAQASTYYPDYYGAMQGINAGVPSDRLLADWFLDSPQVAACAAGQPGLPADLAAPAHRIAIPADFARLLASDIGMATRERLRLRAQIQAALASGLVIRGFDVATHSYLLTP